jgi:hypothetical protein
MIVFDLACRAGGHRFEGWFGSSAVFAAQQERGLVACPECGSTDVVKAPMAANLGRKGNQSLSDRPTPGPTPSPSPLPAQARLSTPATSQPSPPPASQPQAMAKVGLSSEAAAKVLQAMAAVQREALKDSRWVGDGFAEQSRAMHYGERGTEAIHGQATIAEAEALREEGIAVAPLLFPVAPPGESN